jgi:hypothetical protein
MIKRYHRHSAPELRAGSFVTRPDGVRVQLPKDWSALTVEDLAELGIVPGDQPASFIPLDELTESDMRPLSARMRRRLRRLQRQHSKDS